MSAYEVLAVVGATATGKTELAVELAQSLNGEIINADVSQCYRGMDIGTAKIPADERRGIPHHQIDVMDVTDEASVAAYQRHARADMEQIIARGKLPIVVGGSGLYVRALLDRLDIPPTEPAVREKYERVAQQLGAAAMHRELARRDPKAARAILPSNTRRVVRALEVMELTGRPFAASAPVKQFMRPTRVIGLRMPLAELNQRIDVRTKKMFAQGLVEETRHLMSRGLERGRTASRAIGYSQALEHINEGMSFSEAVASTSSATKRYAKRQRSWLRPDPRPIWLDANQPSLLERALEVAHAEETTEGTARC